MRILIVILLFPLAFISCQKDESPVMDRSELLIGNWTNPQYADTLITYTRAASLTENEPGITFEAGNKMMERKNSGWCGTPPITTADYDGTWTRNDSIVTIAVGYWGGTAGYTWKIITLNEQKLVISIVKAVYTEGK
jgi:hypothetical protein